MDLTSYTVERYLPENEGEVANEHIHRYLFSVKYLKGKIVLDIACGEGYGSALQSKYAKRVIGVDLDKAIIEKAKIKYRRINLEFRVGSTSNIPLESSSVDVITSFETIEHHSEHIEMMNEIKRVLKKNGILILSAPDKKTYSDDRNYINKFHVKELYINELEKLADIYFNYKVLLKQGSFKGSSVIRRFHTQYSTDNIVGNLENHFTTRQQFLYNILIASDSEILEMNDSNYYYQFENGIFSIEDYEKGRRQVLDTISFKIGYFITSPMRRIKKLFK